LHSQTEAFCANINRKCKWLQKIIVDDNDLTSTGMLLQYNYHSSNSQRPNYRIKRLTHTTGAKGSLADFCIHKGTCVCKKETCQVLAWFMKEKFTLKYWQKKTNNYKFWNFNSFKSTFSRSRKATVTLFFSFENKCQTFFFSRSWKN